MGVEVRLGPRNFSSAMADAMPNKLVVFRGVAQEQGDWQCAVEINRRLVPSLKPSYRLNIAEASIDEDDFLRSWEEFYRLQRYTDGEGFFLCYPAAYQFGIFAKKGVFDLTLQPSWNESYLHDQNLTVAKDWDEQSKRNSNRYNWDIQQKYKVIERQLQSEAEIRQAIEDTEDENTLQVVQISGHYPMFGNKRFGHYISVVRCENEQVLIAGSLGPFGIYDTPFAWVDKAELARFIWISKQIQIKSERSASVKLADGKDNTAVEVMTVDLGKK